MRDEEKMKKIDWFIILFIIIISCIALRDLFRPGFYTSHDGIHQVVRLYYFDAALREGQFPPRWVGGLLNGFGYPLFIFSYHLPWLIAEPLHLFGLSIFDSIKMTFLIGFILSGITMYIFQKEIFGRGAAFVGSFLYLFAPYRFSNIFVRAAIGDATAFIFPPLLFLSLFKLRKENKLIWKWVILGAISLAGILLSHAMVFLFFFIAILLYIMYSLVFLKKRLKFLFASALLIVFSFGVSAYYFIPSLMERNYTKFTEIMRSVFVGKTFLNLKELVYSPWGYGVMHAQEGGMSFQLGIAQWIVFVFSIGLLIFLVVKRKKKGNSILIRDMFFYIVLFIGSLGMMLPFSSPVWQVIQRFVVIDFTWRILPVTLFALSVLGGFLVSHISYSWVLASLLILLAIYGNRNHLKRNLTLDWPLSFYLQLEKTTNSYHEYTPKWVKEEAVEKQKPLIEFSIPEGEVKIQKANSSYVEFLVKTSQDGVVKLNKVYYPGWNVAVNGHNTPIQFENSGLIEFPVSPGTSKIIARFSETPLRLLSNFISIGTFLIMGYFWKKYQKNE